MKFCLALLMLAGCGLPILERSYAPPTKEILFETVQQRRQMVATMRATAKVDQAAQGGRVKVKVDLAFAEKGRLHIEIHSPLGGTAATLVSDGEHFLFLDSQRNRFFTGPACAENVERFLQVRFAPEEINAILAGSAPLQGTPVSTRWERRGGREVLELGAPDGSHETLFLDGKEKVWDLLIAEHRAPNGKTLWRIEHSDYSENFPARTRVTQQSAHLELRFKSREPNVALPDELFRLAPPPGFRVETVTCP